MPEKKTSKPAATPIKSEKQTGPPKSKGSGRYYEAIGRRKEAIARVRLFTSNPDKSVEKGNLLINSKPYKEYFPILNLQNKIEAPFVRLKSLSKFSSTVKVEGGGIAGQAEAVQHGIARALVLFDENFRKRLKTAGYLTRDARAKERRKFGLKKARKAPQWSKR